MRTIKFRVWDNELKKYRSEKDGDYSLGVLSGTVRGIYGEKFPQMEVEQFTGINDKNAMDIYDGDIVECKKTTNKFSYKFTSVVIMQYGCFGIITDRFIPLKDLIDGNIKIIGNIHENPELL